jgi:putative endonuclease
MQNSGMDEWYVYIVRCRDGSLYTGIATDVDPRLAEHEAGRGSKYLRGRGPLKLVFKRRVGQRGRALKIEREIKELSRQKKQELIQDTGRAAFESLFMNEEKM